MEINDFRQIMISLSKGMKFAKDFTDEETVRIWHPSFREVPLETFKTACRLALETLKEFPSIKELKDLCNGNPLSDDEAATDLAIYLESLIQPFGYNAHNERSVIRARLEERLGYVGLEVIKSYGGWYNFCTRVDQGWEVSQFRKELKAACASVQKKLRMCGENRLIDYKPPQLIEDPIKKALGLLGVAK